MPIFSSTITDLASNKMPQPYYRFDGSNDYIQVADNANVDLGTNDFSFEALVYSENWSGTGGTYEATILSKHVGGNDTFRWYVDNTNLHFYGTHTGVSGSSFDTKVAGAFTSADDGKWFHLAVVVVRGVSGTLYKNGVALTNTTSGVPTTADVSTAANFDIGRTYLTTYAPQQIAKVRKFNHALSATEVKELYSGASVPFKYKGANQTSILTGDASLFTSSVGGWSATGGSIAIASNQLEITGNGSAGVVDVTKVLSGFTIGKAYRYSCDVKRGSSSNTGGYIAVYDTSGSGVNISLQFSTTGGLTTSMQRYSFEFIATATSLTMYITKLVVDSDTYIADNATVIPIGAVAEYDGSGIASDKWFDKSGNDLHGTVTGATVENAPSGDDGLVYEEGYWTPTLKDPSNVEPSYFSHHGTYTRVGRLVTFQGTFYIQSTSGMGGTIEINDLPYTSTNQTAVTFGELRQTDRGGSGNLTFLASTVGATTRNTLVVNDGDGKNNSSSLQTTAIGYASQWFFGGTYEI